MNTFQIGPFAAIPVVVGAAAIVARTVSLPAEKPGCVNCLLQYTPGVAGRTLTVSIEYGDAAGAVWLAPQSGASIAITADACVQLGLPGGPNKFRIKFASAGGAGADDSVIMTLQGLPTGTTTA